MQLRVTLASATAIDPNSLAGILDAHFEISARPFGYAAQAFIEHDDPETLRARLNTTGASVGVIDGPLLERDAGLLLLDVDSTLTTTEAIDLLAAQVGRGDEVASITEAAMRGELDFAQSLRARVAVLRGLPAKVLAEVGPKMTLSPGAAELIALAHDAGAKVGVTSGGFSQLVAPLAETLGIDFYSANQLGITRRDGVDYLSGEVVGAVVDRQRKAQDLQDFAARSAVPIELSVAVGDGANDLSMLATAGLGIAYCAKPVTALQADVSLNFPRLDAVAAFAFPSRWGE